MLCQYKNLFGKPNTGLHKYRIFNLAIVDIIATFIGAYGTALITDYSYICSLLGLFILGIFLHRLFCVRTTIDKLLFP